jgi:hypothetical protein
VNRLSEWKNVSLHLTFCIGDNVPVHFTMQQESAACLGGAAKMSQE